METNLIFIENLKRRMKEYDMNQEKVAKVCGISAASVSTWMSLKTMPKFENLYALAKHFNCSVADLLTFDQNVPDIAVQKNGIINVIETHVEKKGAFSAIVELAKELDSDELRTLSDMFKFMAKEK